MFGRNNASASVVGKEKLKFHDVEVGSKKYDWLPGQMAEAEKLANEKGLSEYDEVGVWDDFVRVFLLVPSPQDNNNVFEEPEKLDFEGGEGEESIKQLRALFKPSEVLCGYARGQGGEAAVHFVNMMNSLQMLEGMSKLQIASMFNVATRYTLALQDGYVWEKPVNIPDGQPQWILEGALQQKRIVNEIPINSFNFLGFVHQYDFEIIHKVSSCTVTYGGVTVEVDSDSGTVMDDKAAQDFLVAWSNVNKGFQFVYTPLDMYHRFMAYVLCMAYVVKIDKENWKFDRNSDFNVAKATKFWGGQLKRVEGFLSGVITLMREETPLRGSAGIKNKQGILDRLMCVVKRMFDQNKDDYVMAQQLHERHKKLFYADPDVQLSLQRIATGIYPGLEDAATLAKTRQESQGKRNVGPREMIAKRMCAVGLEELPNGYGVAAKFGTLMKRFEIGHEGAVDVFGTANQNFAEVIDKRFPKNEKNWFDIAPGFCGPVGGRTVNVKDITLLDNGYGKGKVLIDDTFVKTPGEKNVWNQYVKLRKIVAAGYSGFVSKMMIGVDEMAPGSLHPLANVYSYYEHVFLSRPGKQQSGEYFVSAWGLRKPTHVVDTDVRKMEAFFKIARASMWTSDIWMNAVTRYCVREKMPQGEKGVAVGWRLPVVDRSTIVHKGIMKKTGARKLAGTTEDVQLVGMKEGEDNILF